MVRIDFMGKEVRDDVRKTEKETDFEKSRLKDRSTIIPPQSVFGPNPCKVKDEDEDSPG